MSLSSIKNRLISIDDNMITIMRIKDRDTKIDAIARAVVGMSVSLGVDDCKELTDTELSLLCGFVRHEFVLRKIGKQK